MVGLPGFGLRKVRNCCHKSLRPKGSAQVCALISDQSILRQSPGSVKKNRKRQSKKAVFCSLIDEF
jgi:hypothetical protein